jgi:predicted nucleic acid-binding protein
MIVVDASVVNAILLEEPPANQFGLLTKLLQETAIAPALLSYEVRNTLLMAQRRNRIGGTRRLAQLTAFGLLNIRTESAPSNEQFATMDELATKHRLTIYDASYLELSMRRKLTMATFDRELRSTALLAGVPIFPETF